MATFFGEVVDVSSRSSWWSDDDTDEPKQYLDDDNFFININDKQLLQNIQEKSQRIFVSNVKYFHKDSKTVFTISMLDESKSTLGNLVTLNFINENECWLAISSKLLSSYNYLTVKLVNFIFKNLLDNFKPNSYICMVSKDFSKSSHVKYLKSIHNDELNTFVSDLEKNCPINILMAPETSTNELELAFMEYCIVYKKNFILFIIPSVLDIKFIPNIILDGINQFYDVSRSNLIV